MTKKDDQLPDRESLGGSAYDQQHFSDDELRSAAEIRAAAQSGKTSWEDAHSFVENIRGGYGYSGDSDGSKYTKLPGAQDREFSYSAAPSYSNKYQGKIDELTSALLGRDPFSYDHTKDDTYKQYEQSYTRNGERAMQDTLGQVSARSGGLASSYAASASQQTYDGYMAALSDKIPELKQLAYSMYQDEGNNQRANLQMLMALDQGDFNKYQSLLGQYNNDRNFNYGVFADDKNFDYGVFSDDKKFNYGVSRDELADQRYDDETSYGREQDDWEKSNYSSEKEYNQALQKAQILGASGDFSAYKALGYSDAEIKNLKSAYDKAQIRPSYGGSKSGSSGSGSRSGRKGRKSKNGGIHKSTRAKNATAQIFNDYDKAAYFMEQKGIPEINAYGAMTKSDWVRHKASMQLSGQGVDEVTLYNSYSDYLTDYVKYGIENYGK